MKVLIKANIYVWVVIQVLRKCLVVLEENSDLLKQQWTRVTLGLLMHMIACITYYLSKACLHFEFIFDDVYACAYGTSFNTNHI